MYTDCCESRCVWCGVIIWFCWIIDQRDHVPGGILYWKGEMAAGLSGLFFFFAYCKVKYLLAWDGRI